MARFRINRHLTRRVSAAIVLCVYLLAVLGLPVSLQATSAHTTAAVDSSPGADCGCGAHERCCCSTSASSCQSCCSKLPRAPGLALAPLSCSCHGGKLMWISTGYTLPVKSASACITHEVPGEWLHDAAPVHGSILAYPPVPPPRLFPTAV